MGVFCIDRLTGAGFGLPNILFKMIGEALAALQAPHVQAYARDGYVPSWLARSWGELVFDRLSELVVVARPVPGRGSEMRPVAVYRQGSPAALHWARQGEQLSVYDMPFAPVVLGWAQFCTAGTGHTTTTLRPPAPGTPQSPVAVRVIMVRSGLLSARARPRRPAERRPA